MRRAGVERCRSVAGLVEDRVPLTLLHSIERLAKRLDLLAVLRPVARALRLDGALVVRLGLVGNLSQLR